MKDKLERILRFIIKKGKPSQEIFEIEFDCLTPEEQQSFVDIHQSYCKRKIMEAAEKDERVVERIRKAGEILRKNQNK